MRVVIAMDSFKGSITSMQAGEAAAQGIRRVFPGAEVLVRPIADGGEGTVDALVEGMHGMRETIRVTGPLGMPVECTYGILRESGTAIMEMSAAAGITLVPPAERNPMNTTTYGVGEMIADAIRKGCRNFLIGIGGSATNDGGIGMLQALGFGMYRADGAAVSAGARGLSELCRIETERVMAELAECRFHIACDVKNPLCGENGCSAVYGPQKGAAPAMIAEMDAWMFRYAELAKKVRSDADGAYPGSGAAGGMGFAFRTFMGGELENGIGLILRETGLQEYIRNADIVLTGEGRLDAQTAMGKAPSGVARIAKKYGKIVIALAGSITREAVLCRECGIDAYFPIVRGVSTLEDAMAPENAAANMADTTEQIFRLIKCCSQEKSKW